MPQLRFWFLASVSLFISGCQFPLFSDGIGLPWRRDIADSTPGPPKEHRSQTRDGAIQQVSAEVDAMSNRQQRVFQLLSRGNQELSARRLPDAKLYFEQVLDADPTNFHAHHMLARIGDQTQNYEYAEGHYLAALSASPGDPNLLSDLGYSYLLQGEYGYANTYLRRAVTAKPDHVMARRNLAALAAYQGDNATALAWLRQVGTEDQAQATLRELVSNRPPRFNRKRDPRDELPPDATPAARELAEQLRLAKQKSGREQWKREMAEWAQGSQRSARDVTGTSFQDFQNFDSRGRPMGQRSSDGEMQSAMRALEDEYNQRLAELQRRSSIPPRETSRFQSTQPQTGPPAWELSEQMQRQQMRQEAEAQLRARDGGPPQMAIPPSYQPQQFQGQQFQGQQFQGQQFQGQQFQRQPHQGQYQDPRYYQDPRTIPFDGASSQRGLNPVPNQREVEFLSPPPDFEPASQRAGSRATRTQSEYADPRNPQGPWNPQSGTGPIWNPQTGIPSGANSGATSAGSSVNNAEAARRAMALGMSAGPGSLFPLGASPQNSASVQPPNQQSFNGAVRIQPGFQQGRPQQPSAQPGSVQPTAVNPHWTPGQEFTPPIGGEASFYRNWQRQQTNSPTWDHSTNQPITQQQHWSQAAPVNEAYRNQGVMTSPTTRAGFGSPPFVSREQQQLRSTTPADQLGAPASNAPVSATSDIRAVHNGF